MDRQTAIDRITETENLTDGLEDDDANWLLDWGIAQVDGLVTGIKDEDAAGEKLNQLMSVMRTLNQIAADRAAKAPDALAGDIRTFIERYQQAFGAPKAATPTAAPAADAQTGPTASPTATAPGATSPKAKQDQSAPPTKKGGTVPATPPATSPATPPASSANTTTSGAAQASQASDQASQAASKIAGMSPKQAMQYLLSLAEAGASAA
jgi:hypothetical protein